MKGIMTKQNINFPLQKFLSSRRLGNSETRTKIINLGKALVKELQLDPGVDTLSRWMAHYIAEQITIANSTKGKRKKDAEERCFETILKLWQHKTSLPIREKPFENFEKIWNVIERIDPDNKRNFFYNYQIDDHSKLKKNNYVGEKVQKWLDIALAIDEVARVWLEYIFKLAVQSATDKKTITWLKNSFFLENNCESLIIIELMEKDLEKDKKAKQKGLQSRIQQLDTFISFSKILRKEYVNDMELLKKIKQ